ncbi:AsnC family transcriptional regulator [Shimia abyssi]|uniref:AsnC family transcriptional regulator n=2 Tax=Shimia abyssi TaxID=1662395 RepID=A0A2P8FG67_9RHOB|nr:AsnC family transcriptional regulator [Shimia abyssi]
MAIMDDVDQRLISALRHDARASLSDLAILLGVSRTTVRGRIEKLRQRGDIVGFTVVLQGDTKRDPVRGLMMIGIEGRGADRISRQLAGLTAVRAIHSTNGRWDLILEIGTDTLEELDAVLERIRRLDGIANSETNLLLATKKAG